MNLEPVTGTIHLVRHGKVENPGGVIYGRLPDFHLSELGRAQAKEAAEHLADANIGAIRVSPLERAQETAEVIASFHEVEVITDERLIESTSHFEGRPRSVVPFLTSPSTWWSLRNPFKPSWGEEFLLIRERMVTAIVEAHADARGADVVIVAHQTPVVVARKALVGQWGPPWLWGNACVTGSVTSIELKDGKYVSSSYFVPSG